MQVSFSMEVILPWFQQGAGRPAPWFQLKRVLLQTVRGMECGLYA